ncbi:MAG: DUF6090 family protein [Flavobacteriales bacterium]
MIRFFRSIRQRLLSRNTFSRYLLYAVGEIVLVVIGILIALQLNNWNADRLARAEEREYMTALLEESQLNSRVLAGLAVSNREALKAANRIIAELAKGPGGSNMDTMHFDLARTMTIVTTVLTSNIYKEMESSGNLKLLRNDSVKRAIVDFYASVDLVNSIEAIGVTDQWTDLYTPFVNTHLDNIRILSDWAPPSLTGLHVVKRPPLPFWDLPASHPLKIELGNLLATYYAGVWWVAEEQEKLIERSRNIQRLLRKDLGTVGDTGAQTPLSTFDR